METGRWESRHNTAPQCDSVKYADFALLPLCVSLRYWQIIIENHFSSFEVYILYLSRREGDTTLSTYPFASLPVVRWKAGASCVSGCGWKRNTNTHTQTFFYRLIRVRRVCKINTQGINKAPAAAKKVRSNALCDVRSVQFPSTQINANNNLDAIDSVCIHIVHK